MHPRRLDPQDLEAKQPPVNGTARPWLSTFVILAVTSGCDNVSFGGIDIRLDPPPVTEVAATDTAAADVPPPELPAEPVLFRVDRSGSRARISPVGEISGDSLVPLTSEREDARFRDYFVQERMERGREFTLFAQGARVGRFLLGDSTWVDESACTRPPAASGVVEVVPSAASATRFLALDATHGELFTHGDYSATVVDQALRVTAANVAGTVIMDVGARWPPSMGRARGDVQVFPVSPDAPPVIAGTYLYEDQMAVAEATPASYAFFYLAEDAGEGYRSSYYWYRLVSEEGKGAARYFAHMDWNGDGSPEILLEVLGARERWHAALSRTAGRWERFFEDPCGAPELQAPPAG